MEEKHLVANLAHWDEVAGLHVESYDTASLVSGQVQLSLVVAEDARLLAPHLPDGSVAGLDLIHLQCHIGTDTLSWARLGARVTGVDVSPESLRIARQLSAEAGVAVEYVQSSIHEAAANLAGRSADIVYTSMGALNWLDDLEEWAHLIVTLLRPGGLFFIREGHPMALALDWEAPEGELRLRWPYFNAGPHLDDSGIDYSSPEPVINAAAYEWAHSLSEILGSLLRAGLTIIDFQEHRSLNWRPLPWLVEQGGTFVLPEPLADLCPLAFSLVARR